MKKRGFTLIELVAAVAILTISITAISSAFMTSISVWSRGNDKLETSNYAQGIIEMLRSLGGEQIKYLYNSGFVNRRVYFSEGVKGSSAEGGSVDRSLSNLMEGLKSMPYNIPDQFNTPSNNKYAGSITIEIRNNNSEDSAVNLFKKDGQVIYSIYRVKVDVWKLRNLSIDENSVSTRIYDFTVAE